MINSTEADPGARTPFTRPLLLIAAPVVVLLVIMGVVLLARGQNLRSRSARISAGMSREQVEALLGPPVLELNRTGGRGVALTWVDHLWQVDVRTGPDGRVESVGCVPSNSFFRRTIGRIVTPPG